MVKKHIFIGLLLVSLFTVLFLVNRKTAQPAAAGGVTNALYLPIVSNGVPASCRFGVNVIQSPANMMIEKLRLGWYLNYGTTSSSTLANSATYAPVIRLNQTGPNAEDYTYSPNGTALMNAIAANPKADWLIGNEPDRTDFQDDIEPHVYAAVYAELYNIIKTADPTARVFAGTIVQPTPIRLQYLDMILDSYKDQNGGAEMPVDGWSIHNFILNEVSCDFDPDNCWGAGVPPGSTVGFGEILSIEDNDNIELFKERIVNFRQWMFDNNYANVPLTVSEYGVLMPESLGFDDTRVNTFMTATFDYMLTATDPILGDPNDNHRLVQTWSWFSSGADGDPFNGYLFEGDAGIYPWEMSSMGQNFANYTQQLTPEIDLYPSLFTSEPMTLTTPATITLTVQVANSGTNVFAKDFLVRFYNGDPQNGGVQIGAEQSVSLAGCGYNESVTITWTNVSEGTYQLYAVVDDDSQIYEINEQNNVANIQITVDN